MIPGEWRKKSGEGIIEKIPAVEKIPNPGNLLLLKIKYREQKMLSASKLRTQ